MAKGKALIKLALFGQPVKTSLSPSIHGMFADQLGLNIGYRRIESGPEAFAGALEHFGQDGGVGCNITMPLKDEAWRLSSNCSDQVKLAQAANTLVRESSGWFGHNTDGFGLLTDLAGNHGIPIAGQRILVMGAGGAAAGILGGLLSARPAQVVLVNRGLERAQALADRFASLGNISTKTWAKLPGQAPFDVVINATSLGHVGEVPPLLPEIFAPGSVCYDLNYHRASESLRAWCETYGQRYLDGLGMLVEQAAESFSIWTGQRPDSSAVIRQLRADLA